MKMGIKISAVVLTKNEEKNIRKYLKTLSWCDEIIIIDDNSDDQTKKLAQSFGARVFVHSLNNDFASQRNFGLQKATGDWILFIDADEKVSVALADEVSNVNYQKLNINGFYLKRRDYFLGRWLEHGETAHVKLLRLAKKDAGVWKRKVHETWKIKGKVGELRNSLLHFPHSSISQFLRQVNEYTSLDAYQFYRQGRSFYFWTIFIYPSVKFLQNYFLKAGFLDGFPGLVMAFMMSLHSLITRVKVWELEKKK